ncbi:MAG TPA: NAD(P)-dependent oxidoreductase [Xanthobacteraceae bacterium]|nr:NAD(P)-dependent oxidoreductase [Xanthobacteraceae bacterium]
MSDLRVGFIGIGNMGWPMAKNILKAGNNVLQADHKLHVFDLDKKRVSKFTKDEPNSLGTAEASAVAKASNIVITMLPTGPIVREVVMEMLENGALSKGTIVVDMSSSEPTGTRQLAEDLSKVGITLIDSPVSGGIIGAQAGTLTLMIGGNDDKAVERVTPVLQTMGAKLFRTGASGSGDVVKALNNYCSAANFRALSEAVSMGEKFGLDPAMIVEIINVSSGRSLSSEGAFKNQVLPGKYAAGFALGLLTKDVKIASDLAGELGISAPVCAVTFNALANAREALGYSADFTVAHKYWNRDVAEKKA